MGVRAILLFAFMSAAGSSQAISFSTASAATGYEYIVILECSGSRPERLVGVDYSGRLWVSASLEEMEIDMKTTITLERLLADINAIEMFERPLGPYANCFSTNQVVRMFEAGARPEELRHMFECPACNDLVARSSRLGRMLEVENSPEKATGFGQTLRELLLRDKPGASVPDVAAVLGLADPVVEVTDLDTPLSVIVELLPCVDSNVVTLDVSTLRLEGAATSESAMVERSDTGSGQLSRVTFRDARLSKAVRKGLSHHARVADQISVSGVLKGETDRLFLGKATMEVVQLQKARD